MRLADVLSLKGGFDRTRLADVLCLSREGVIVRDWQMFRVSKGRRDCVRLADVLCLSRDQGGCETQNHTV